MMFSLYQNYSQLLLRIHRTSFCFYTLHSLNIFEPFVCQHSSLNELIVKGSLLAFVNACQGVTDYLQQSVTLLITLHSVSANCMQRRSCFTTPLGELNLKSKSGSQVLKFGVPYNPRPFNSSRPTHPFHFQGKIIWCDCTFKCQIAC